MVYVDSVLEYSRQRKKEKVWGRIKADLAESEKRLQVEGGISSKQLREDLTLITVQETLDYWEE